MSRFTFRPSGFAVPVPIIACIVLVGLVLAGWRSVNVRQDTHEDPPQVAALKNKYRAVTPADGYLKAHRDLIRPLTILGGAIKTTITQNGGGVFVALPDKRVLDPYVFGTPSQPRSFGGTPGISGVPLEFRNSEGNRFTNLQKMTPFGDKHLVMGGASLKLNGVDSTATDAKYTQDSIEMEASWKDADGNTYTVKCNKVIPAGLEFPTFGGVVTNHILHGWSRLGTPLMPTEFTYFAFWGIGEVSKNGKVLDPMRVVHGMLTEYVRKEGYKLAMDDEVTPGRLQFHLMVAPFKPNMEGGYFDHVNVKTGFNLPNGMELPFWHVMFETLDIQSERQ